jgi:hypothetical protein
VGEISVLGVCKLPDPALTGSDRTRAELQVRLRSPSQPLGKFLAAEGQKLNSLSCAGLREAEIMTPNSAVRPAPVKPAAIAAEM